MSAGQRYPTIPENADKILFAEDLVNHILSKLSLPALSSGIADHRNLVYNAFGPQERLAANYRLNSVKEAIKEYFERLIRKVVISSKVFLKYIEFFKPFLREFTRPETHAQIFLDTSVQFSLMAGQFYMYGILDAPTLVVDHIVSIIKKFDMVNGGGWKAVNTLSARWAQYYVPLIKGYLSPTYDYDFDNNNNLSDPEMVGGEDSDQDLDNDDEYFEEFLYSFSFAANVENVRIKQNQKLSCYHSKESGSFSKKYETYVQAADDILPLGKPLPERLDIVGPKLNEHHKTDSDDGKFEKISDASIYSIENISREYDIFMQNITNQNEDPSCSYWMESDSNSKKYKKDVQTADDINSFCQRMNEDRLAIFSFSVNELPEMHYAQHLKISNSDNLTAGRMKTSSVAERCRIQIFVEETGRRKKAVPKKRNVFASKH